MCVVVECVMLGCRRFVVGLLLVCCGCIVEMEGCYWFVVGVGVLSLPV